MGNTTIVGNKTYVMMTVEKAVDNGWLEWGTNATAGLLANDTVPVRHKPLCIDLMYCYLYVSSSGSVFVRV